MLSTKEANLLTRRIIGCAISVHRFLGPGLLESIYELCLEFQRNQLNFNRDMPVPINYRGCVLGKPLVLDILVEGEIIQELKSVETLLPIHEAQLLSYMRLAKKSFGLLINFNVAALKDGVRRKILDPLPITECVKT